MVCSSLWPSLKKERSSPGERANECRGTCIYQQSSKRVGGCGMGGACTHIKQEGIRGPLIMKGPLY